MSLQTIVNNATYVTIDKKKVASQSVSRSGVVLTAERTSVVPYRFIIGMHEGLKYSTNRGLLEDIDALDVTTESTIEFGGSSTGLAFLTNYQGNSTGIGSISIIGSSAATLIINASAAGSGTYLFKKGDYIQPASGYRYPFQVTADVAHTTSASVSIPIHRPFIEQSGYSLNGKSLLVGNDVTFKVKMIMKPSYSAVPIDRISFTDDFELIEIVTT
tara:strand:+ start:185 stop:832 length:648 start_codon:yes stop_codon:yes gene_type:complete